MEEGVTFINPEDEKRLNIFESIYDELLECAGISRKEMLIRDVLKQYSNYLKWEDYYRKLDEIDRGGD